MTAKSFYLRLLALSLAAIFWIATPLTAQTNVDRDNNTVATPQDRDRDRDRDRDNDTTRGELANFDRFLDSHPEVSEQLRKDPSLIDNREFVEKHPELQSYLQDHPRVREEIKENPNAFMHAENRYERHEEGREERHEDRGDNDTTHRQLRLFDQFADSHPEISEQLRKNPSLVNDREFVQSHPALQEFLQNHPGVREEIKENPKAFMHAENRYDRREERREDGDNGRRRNDGDTTRREVANFDHFMDGHPEIAEQLRKNPSLVDNREFVEQHPALHDYLKDHPAVREEIKENPNAFMRKENRYERTEDRHDGDMHRDHDRDHDRDMKGESGGFGEFLGAHSSISEQVSKDPSLLKNQEYLASHPELQQYLKAHPGADAQFQANPNSFTKPSQQPAKTAPVKTPTPDPKGKQ